MAWLMQGRWSIQKTYTRINWACFCIGLIGVWVASESWLAMLFAWLTSFHLCAGKTLDVRRAHEILEQHKQEEAS